MMQTHYSNKLAFTLMELVITIIIIGTLASIALPSFGVVIETSRSGEGVEILQSLRNAQSHFFLENGQFADTLDDLDVEIPAPQYFVALADSDILAAATQADNVAQVRRNGGLYTLSIAGDGDITCASADTLCARMGY